MTKVLSNVMLVLSNVIMESSNVRKKIREPPNVTKEKSHVILELHNMRMKSSNVTKVQSHVTLVLHNVMMKSSNVRKKIREPLNVTKVL